MFGFSLSGFTYPNMSMLAPVKALSYIEPLRHYYLIYVNEALMGAPSINSLPYSMALMAFVLLALLASPRLKRILINDQMMDVE